VRLRSLARSIRLAVTEVWKEALGVAADLFKLLIPVIVFVKILEEIGAVSLLARILEPLMGVAGLPGETGLVWAAAIVTNIYGGIATLLAIFPEVDLSIREMTVLTTMMLLCHSMPVELALTKKVGGPLRLIAPLRFFGALFLGFLLHTAYEHTGALSATATILWIEQAPETSLLIWAYNQLKNLIFTFVVIFALLLLMRMLNACGLITLLSSLLSPLLKLMGISARASTIAVFGLLAGITFGSGLLLAEVKKNKVRADDVVLVLAFLSLCHGIIEDTSLMLLLGADLSGILWARLAFAIIVTAALSFTIKRLRRPHIPSPSIG